MGKIRILHFVSSLSKSSGVMSVVMNYYRHINRNKIQFDFLYFKELENTYKREIEDLGGNVFLISKPSLSRKFKKELDVILSNQENRYTALHIHEVYLTFLLAPVAKKFGISNIITHSHTTMYSDKRISSVRNRILCSRLKKHANCYFACSKAAGDFLYGKKSVINGKVTVINNAIICEKFSYSESTRNKIRKILKLEDSFVIGHVGRFNEAKNHIFLIKVFSEITQKKKNAKLILIGEGPIENRIKKLVGELGLENRVLFLGTRADVNELMQAMDVFLFPSLFEGFGIALIEAQVAGLPCFASKTIPAEVKVTKLVKYLDINASSKLWSDSVVNVLINNRGNMLENVRNAGFDIKSEAPKLERIYCSLNC